MADTKFSQFASGTTMQVGDISVGLRSGVNTQFAFPGTGINDASGNPLLRWVSGSATAINYILFNSAIINVDPTITGTGPGANVGLTLTTKGTGDISLLPATTGLIRAQSSIQFKNATAVQTGQTGGDTLLLQAYDNNSPGFTTFATLTAGITPTFDINATTLTLTTPLDVNFGGTGTNAMFTAGSVVFAGPSGVYTQDNLALFYDNTNFRLGINTSTPTQTLDVFGTTKSSQIRSNVFSNSAGDTVLTFSSPVGLVVNNFNFTPSIAGNPPILSLFGSDPAIGITIQAKSTGQIDIQSQNIGPITFLSGTGLIHRATFQFANTLSTQTITFPDGNGTVLMTGQAINSVPSIQFSSTSGIIGTTTNNNAAAGSVGEAVTSTVAINSVALTSLVTTNITSISLTAGDWDVLGVLNYFGGATTITVYSQGGISLVSATQPAIDFLGGFFFGASGAVVYGTAGSYFSVPPRRISIAATTTVYLVSESRFTTSTTGGGGTIFARRVR